MLTSELQQHAPMNAADIPGQSCGKACGHSGARIGGNAARCLAADARNDTLDACVIATLHCSPCSSRVALKQVDDAEVANGGR